MTLFFIENFLTLETISFVSRDPFLRNAFMLIGNGLGVKNHSLVWSESLCSKIFLDGSWEFLEHNFFQPWIFQVVDFSWTSSLLICFYCDWRRLDCLSFGQNLSCLMHFEQVEWKKFFTKGKILIFWMILIDWNHLFIHSEWLFELCDLLTEDRNGKELSLIKVFMFFRIFIDFIFSF